MIGSWDSDGHVEEGEATFSDLYLEPAFRDRRPEVVDPDGDGMFRWKIHGRTSPFKFGGSPVSMGNKPSIEQDRLGEWRGTIESAELKGPEARLALMDDENIDLQVNYPTLFLQWPVAPDAALNQALTRAYNNWIADMSNRQANRLKWVAVIDYNDPAEAAREIERSKRLGAIGVMVAGWVGDNSIADAKFEPIWSAAAEADISVAVHPCVASTSFGDQQFHFSVLSGFYHVIVSGILDRYPKLRVGFLETSCRWVDFMMWRAEEAIDSIKERLAVGIQRGRSLPEMTPNEYLATGRLFFGFEAEDAMLPYVVDRWGPDIWLYASDIPHAHRILDATTHISAREDLSQEVKQKLLVDNTARFYGMPVPNRN